MKQILTIKEAIKMSKSIKGQNKTIVLAGGCFDMLHIGHLTLLEKAKEQGDIFFVLLESDEKIQSLKGKERPVHTQQERALMLAALRYVDYVVLLPFFSENSQYDQLIKDLHPDVIATTDHDPYAQHKKRQADITGAKLRFVTNYVPQKSSTRIMELLQKEL